VVATGPTATAEPAAPTVVAASPTTAEPTGTPSPTTAASNATPFSAWPAAEPLPQPLSLPNVNQEEQASWDQLAAATQPDRDDIALASAYRGFDEALLATPALVSEPLAVGTRQRINVLNHDENTISQIEAVLLAIGQHAYFWFDTGPGSFEPDADELEFFVDSFDDIYEANVAIFGSENNPGIDGDSRVHVVNASPLALCSVSLSTADECSLAGYFSSSDVLPVGVDPNSNEREMFVMNMWFFGSTSYLDVLAHEQRHMIEDNYDKGDADWEVEGSAMLAEDLLGYPQDAIERGNLFLENPDQQLNRWTDGYTIPFYGQGYLMNRYIYDRLGHELYQEFAVSPASGLAAVDAIAAAHGLELSGQSIWLDWLVALAIHEEAGAPEQYRFGVEGLDTPATVFIQDYPESVRTTVEQFAADYYALAGDGTVSVSFQGSAEVPLLGAPAASGQSFWYAHRSNYSDMRLTRELDLTAAESATLEYMVYYDIEHGYDFAYVSISTDGGESWQGLVGERMQSRAAGDDPSQSAYLEDFYTGREGRWLPERIDLSQHAGQVIQLRFEYVTDPILTFGGFALDNIAVPEIGFYDDAETALDGWLAEGFSRVTAALPQQWHLQLITFPEGAPTVTALPLDATAQASLTFDLSASARPPILIVAATAPQTLEVGEYRLELSR
jgi:hypothetical protein